MAQRVAAYIDGFNLYFGLKDRGWKRFYWLDVALLVENLLKPGQELAGVKYFTARISDPPDKQSR
ncbi:MAG: NYN domain-containing protein [Actinomycetota bacterium]|nr:NYN domain-containing protein [Actinomycetota bacterium]